VAPFAVVGRPRLKLAARGADDKPAVRATAPRMSETTHVEISGPPRVDSSYMGRPLRVPLSRAPDSTWQVRLTTAPRTERIRYMEVDGDSLVVFPAHGWTDREEEVLDTVVQVIAHANESWFQARRAREEAEKRAEAVRQEADAERESKLAGWWESRQGA
jgi:hypothetical protein